VKTLLQHWEKLRSSKTSTEEKTDLVQLILDRSKGRVAELSKMHSSSRVVQSCLKFGSTQHRDQIVEELKPELVALAQSQYGHFLVKKILSMSEEGGGKKKKNHSEGGGKGLLLPFALNAFRGKVVPMLRHPCGAQVIDDLYHLCSSRQRQQMAAEFYGPEVALLANLAMDDLSLETLLAKATPAQRAAVLTHIFMKLSPILDKGLVDSHLVHFVIRELLRNAAPGAIQEAAQTLAGPHLLHLVHTSEGASAAVDVVCASNAKGRKKIVRAMKGSVAKCATEEHGHAVLLCVLGVVDDTVLVDKTVSKELASSLKDVCFDKYGKRVLLRLLAPSKLEYIPPNVQEMLKPNERVVKASALKLPSLEDSDDEEEVLEEDVVSDDEKKKPVLFKKPLEVKCRELLFGASLLAPNLVRFCAAHSREMLCSPHASQVLAEVVVACEGGGVLDGKVEQKDVADLLGALENLLSSKSVLEDFYGTRALSVLVQRSESVWQLVAKLPDLTSWKGTHAEKVAKAFARRQEGKK